MNQQQQTRGTEVTDDEATASSQTRTKPHSTTGEEQAERRTTKETAVDVDGTANDEGQWQRNYVSVVW
jgi:hypothetical protein